MALISFNLEKTSRLPRVPGYAAMIVAAWALLIVLFNVYLVKPGHVASPCMFKNVTGGVPCATCGATRAAVDLWHGDVASAFWRNPLVLALEVMVLAWLSVRLATGWAIRMRAAPWTRAWLWALAAVLFFANWAHVIVVDGPWAQQPSAISRQPSAELETANVRLNADG